MATKRRTTKRPRKARTRRTPGKKRGEPNGLELYHRQTHIEDRLKSGELSGVIGYECWTFELFLDAEGKHVNYTPDWVVQRSDSEIELHETKGGRWMGDSRIRFKAAAARYPMFHWTAYVYSGKKIKKVEAL